MFVNAAIFLPSLIFLARLGPHLATIFIMTLLIITILITLKMGEDIIMTLPITHFILMLKVKLL